MSHDSAATERAALILAERTPGPRDRLDASLMLADQEFLWRRDGADFREAVRLYEAGTGKVLSRPMGPPSFGIPKRRDTGYREAAVWIEARFVGRIVGSGRPCRVSDCTWGLYDPIWRFDDRLSICLGLSHEAARREPLDPIVGAERRATELAYTNLLYPGP